MREADQRLIDVGGSKLALRTTGTGTPVVVCLSCCGGAHEEWEGVVELLAPTTTCVTYGRPALGGSEPLPSIEAAEHRTGRWAAHQLRTLLQRADIPPPYVLVSGSIGGWVADQYAALWPDEIANMVLIDPTSLSPFPGLADDDRMEVAVDDEDGGTRFSRRLCYAEQRELVPTNVPRPTVLSSAQGRWLRYDGPVWHEPLTLDQVEHYWQRFQREWVDRLHARHLIAHTAGHLVHDEQPALAAHVIRAVVEATRDNRDVQFDEAALDEAGGRICKDHES